MFAQIGPRHIVSGSKVGSLRATVGKARSPQPSLPKTASGCRDTYSDPATPPAYHDPKADCHRDLMNKDGCTGPGHRGRHHCTRTTSRSSARAAHKYSEGNLHPARSCESS